MKDFQHGLRLISLLVLLCTAVDIAFCDSLPSVDPELKDPNLENSLKVEEPSSLWERKLTNIGSTAIRVKHVVFCGIFLLTPYCYLIGLNGICDCVEYFSYKAPQIPEMKPNPRGINPFLINPVIYTNLFDDE
jgi:hypothetical protein